MHTNSSLNVNTNEPALTHPTELVGPELRSEASGLLDPITTPDLSSIVRPCPPDMPERGRIRWNRHPGSRCET